MVGNLPEVLCSNSLALALRARAKLQPASGSRQGAYFQGVEKMIGVCGAEVAGN